MPRASELKWYLSEGKESFESVLEDDPDIRTMYWVFDGTTTHDWRYAVYSGRLSDIVRYPGVPPGHLRVTNWLAPVVGWDDYFHQEGGLNSRVQAAIKRQSISATKMHNQWTLALGMQPVKDFQCDFNITIDSEHDFRLRSWTLQDVLPGRPRGTAFQFVVDEFQSLPDTTSNRPVWFPTRAHVVTPLYVANIDKIAVRINGDIDPNVFISPEPPSGTSIRDKSNVSGVPPRISVAGGEAARQRKLDELARQAQAELGRLDREGVAYNATPPGSIVPRIVAVSGALLLLLALMCWAVRRMRN